MLTVLKLCTALLLGLVAVSNSALAQDEYSGPPIHGFILDKGKRQLTIIAGSTGCTTKCSFSIRRVVRKVQAGAPTPQSPSDIPDILSTLKNLVEIKRVEPDLCRAVRRTKKFTYKFSELGVNFTEDLEVTIDSVSSGKAVDAVLAEPGEPLLLLPAYYQTYPALCEGDNIDVPETCGITKNWQKCRCNTLRSYRDCIGPLQKTVSLAQRRACEVSFQESLDGCHRNCACRDLAPQRLEAR